VEDDVQYRETCLECRRPAAVCWCSHLTRVRTDLDFLFLVHPKEARRQKTGTGAMAWRAVEGSRVVVGIRFNEGDLPLLEDPKRLPVLLFPGPGAVDLTSRGFEPLNAGDRRITVVVVDGTWSCASGVVHGSPPLLALPRVTITADGPSRFAFKRQPAPGCICTLEATAEVIRARLIHQGRPDEAARVVETLLRPLHALVELQQRCARERGTPRWRCRREPA
jgi:DTW domain-containing protein YfiP